VKVGYAGQNFPSFIYPSMIGRPILRAEEVKMEDFLSIILILFFGGEFLFGIE